MDEIAMIDPSATGSAADTLAARFPDPDRKRMTLAFEAFSKSHAEYERDFGIPSHDPGCAITAFIVGSLMASSGSEVPFEQYEGLLTQLRRGFAVHPEVVVALHLDRGSVPEQFEIIGNMLMGYSGNRYAQRRGLAGAVAKRYVQRYLGFDLGDIELTDVGLRWVRGTPSGPLAVLVQR
jgi:hypothetical protein